MVVLLITGFKNFFIDPENVLSSSDGSENSPFPNLDFALNIATGQDDKLIIMKNIYLDKITTISEKKLTIEG